MSAGILFLFIAWDLWGFANAHGPKGALWAAGGAASCFAIYQGIVYMLGLWLAGPEMAFVYIAAVTGVLGTWFGLRKVIGLIGAPKSKPNPEG